MHFYFILNRLVNVYFTLSTFKEGWGSSAKSVNRTQGPITAGIQGDKEGKKES